MDIGSAVGRANGLTDAQLSHLPHYATVESVYSPLEIAALRYCDAMCQLPVDVPDDVFDFLRAQLTDGQLVELTAMIAWENYRSRFNSALRIGSDGFSAGAFCVLPVRAEKTS